MNRVLEGVIVVLTVAAVGAGATALGFELVGDPMGVEALMTAAGTGTAVGLFFMLLQMGGRR